MRLKADFSRIIGTFASTSDGSKGNSRILPADTLSLIGKDLDRTIH